MNEEELLEQARLVFPSYLTPQKQAELWAELRRAPRDCQYYWLGAEERLLQGDGWRGFVVIHFDTLERKTVTGVVLSNSCDVNPLNVRALPTNILFAPVIPLERYCERLRSAGQTTQQIESVCNALRSQEITSLFYLPELPGVMQASLVLLDDVHSQPLADFLAREPVRLFSLTQVAFYLLLIKLSIHFLRVAEGIWRGPETRPAPSSAAGAP